MARKVWILALSEAHRGPKQEGIDVVIVTDDNTGGTEAQAQADAAYPSHADAWSTTLGVEQDGSVTPTGNGTLIVAGKRKTAAIVAIAV